MSARKEGELKYKKEEKEDAKQEKAYLSGKGKIKQELRTYELFVPRPYGDFSMCAVGSHAIAKVLDEARKDFPCAKCDAFETRSCEGPQYHCPSVKQRDWFLKWLGSSEKKK